MLPTWFEALAVVLGVAVMFLGVGAAVGSWLRHVARHYPTPRPIPKSDTGPDSSGEQRPAA